MSFEWFSHLKIIFKYFWEFLRRPKIDWNIQRGLFLVKIWCKKQNPVKSKPKSRNLRKFCVRKVEGFSINFEEYFCSELILKVERGCVFWCLISFWISSNHDDGLRGCFAFYLEHFQKKSITLRSPQTISLQHEVDSFYSLMIFMFKFV